MNYLTLTISLIALFISVSTFWLSRIKKGVVKKTRPTVIFFGPDGVGKDHKKIFIRTLLYSTSDKGKYVQNMFIRLQRDQTVQNFNVWVYGDKELVRGSGLFINKNGLASNHHFLLPKDCMKYDFLAGEYNLQVFVETVNENPIKIFEQKLIVIEDQHSEMLGQKSGLYFDWAPDTQNYLSHIDRGHKKPEELTDLIKIVTQSK